MGHRRRRLYCRRRLSAALIAALAVLVLAGCSLREATRPEIYTVERGDTLYSIASEHALSWRDLARWNRIRPPYRIEVGQRLSLDPYPPIDYSRMSEDGSASKPATTRERRRPRAVRAPQDSRAEQERAIQASTPQLDRTIERDGRSAGATRRDAGDSQGEDGEDEAPEASPPQPIERPAPTIADESEINQASRERPVEPTRTGGPSEDGWQWPASGSILREYGADRTRQGIDIGGREGSPVYAASSGRVVYNGTGLKGYGQLIIIQHDEAYLSAYGFNRRTRVEQGQDVAAGAHIADMGRGPQNKPMLHFEIRKNGEPIDPESVLPAD
ncbi:peptidase M23 [Salinisphaera orenii YIM 95161]|uniref:Peptidase M23 n=1 Tax=Salinisphaera orenii YIM 95161 TaxID=1051139 RepID=A0A423Q1G6_9GAMM|nr:peptidase M23 [Salinisphaera halophila YIM 95161]